MSRRKYGLLTEKQYLVLKLRLLGKTQEEIARILGTSRENVAIIEKKARENIELALRTVKIYKELLAAKVVILEPGTHLVRVPAQVIEAANSVGVKLKANFTRLYDEIRYKAGECISGVKVVKPIKILILKNGDFEVEPATE